MAWTAPRTWFPLETVTSGLLNTHLRDNLNILKTRVDDSGFLKVALFSVAYAGAPSTGVNQNSGTGETSLTGHTFTLPAAMMADGDGWHLRVMLAAAANAATKTLRLDIAGQKATIWTSAANVANHFGFVDVYVERRSSTTAAVTGVYYKDAAAGAQPVPILVNAAFASINFAIDQTVKLTAQGTTGTGDLFVTMSSWVPVRGAGQLS